MKERQVINTTSTTDPLNSNSPKLITCCKYEVTIFTDDLHPRLRAVKNIVDLFTNINFDSQHVVGGGGIYALKQKSNDTAR